jgi:NADH-quinone oxidoreductase subunit A
MNNIMFTPAMAFLIIMIITLLSMVSAGFFAVKGKETPGKREPYACGEKSYDHMVRPDYFQFFSFAFFFTIMHVVALVIATYPPVRGISLIPVIYIAGAVIGLFILFRR